MPAYCAILIAVIAWGIIFKTKFGLRLRSVGENPQAADTLGINVYALRYSGVLISGLLGGMGGAVFSQSISGNFSAGTIVGQGFISMAAMIFGKWNPLGAMGASLFFGFAQSLCAILIAVIAWVIIFKTKFGLRLRSVGENPQAADTLGINVYAMRYSGVLISGLLGGMGGAVFAQSISGNFSAGTIVGQGFISMAAMIFGKWNPLGAMGASLFFGFAQSLSIIGAQLPVISSIPPVLLQINYQLFLRFHQYCCKLLHIC